jgi:cob(I)alamin adenosyltransferase
MGFIKPSHSHPLSAASRTESIMSISTERGDAGQTSLPGGARLSKADSRVDAYGTIDELISSIGLARALCPNPEIAETAKCIQKELFKIGSAIAGPRTDLKPEVEIDDGMVDRLTKEVHRIESTDGMLADWALPGEDAASAAFDLARTVCRRAERLAVRVSTEGTIIPGNVLRYLNRLSDLLWLYGRLIELEKNVDSKLRTNDGPRWSRAW